MIEKYYVTPQQIHDYCCHLAQQVRGNKYDIIIPFSRGGLIVAQYLAYALNNRNIEVLDINTYEGMSQNVKNTLEKYILKQFESIFDSYNKIEKILLVDDLTDTGHSMDIVAKVLIENFPNIYFDIAVIFDNNYFFNKGNYYYAQKKPDGWVVFPWDLV